LLLLLLLLQLLDTTMTNVIISTLKVEGEVIFILKGEHFMVYIFLIFYPLYYGLDFLHIDIIKRLQAVMQLQATSSSSSSIQVFRSGKRLRDDFREKTNKHLTKWHQEALLSNFMSQSQRR
jgi:hypothetical protein